MWRGKTFYLFFLILYSYLILFSFKAEISVEEWIMLGWLFTMMIDEFRDVSNINSDDDDDDSDIALLSLSRRGADIVPCSSVRSVSTYARTCVYVRVTTRQRCGRRSVLLKHSCYNSQW